MQATNENTTNPEATIIPAQRIVKAFERAHNEGRGALMPYFMSGYPSAEQSVKIRPGRSGRWSGYHRTGHAF